MQSRLHSVIEACTDALTSYAQAIAMQLIIFPWFGIHLPMGKNLLLAASFTSVSIIRKYIIRRFFTKRTEGSAEMERLRGELAVARERLRVLEARA